MNPFWENVYVQTAAYYSVVILCMIVFLAIFELVTKYKNWEEIKKGNLAVAMATEENFRCCQRVPPLHHAA